MGTVDIPGLRKVGNAVTACVPVFEQAHASRAGQLGTGAPAGWTTTASVANAADRWGAFLRQVAGQVRTLGADLTHTAGEFEVADDAAAARNGSIPAGHPAQGRARGYTQ